MKKISFRAAVRLSLYELELCDLPFGLAVGPWRRDRRGLTDAASEHYDWLAIPLSH
ncbi:MAG: hypothetical protein WAU78_01270 [Roseiarcus sp.]